MRENWVRRVRGWGGERELGWESESGWRRDTGSWEGIKQYGKY